MVEIKEIRTNEVIFGKVELPSEIVGVGDALHDCANTKSVDHSTRISTEIRVEKVTVFRPRAPPGP